MSVPVLVSISGWLARLGPWLARSWKQILAGWAVVSTWLGTHKRVVGGVVTAVILTPFAGYMLEFLGGLSRCMNAFTEGAQRGADAINSVNAPMAEFFAVWLIRLNYFIPAGAIFTFSLILFVLSFSLIAVVFVCFIVDVGIAWLNIRVATSKFLQATKD
jgi:hypothetical protein